MIKKEIQKIKKCKSKKNINIRLKASVLADFNKICKSEKLTQEELLESFINAYNDESLSIKEKQ